MWVALLAFFVGVFVTGAAVKLADGKRKTYKEGVEDAVLVLISRGAHGQARNVRKELLERKRIK